MAKKKQEEEKPEIEREYVVPLRRKFIRTPQHKRAKKAVKVLKEFIARHMKIYDKDLRKIKIDKHLNSFIWKDGIKRPPAKIKVKVKKIGEIVNVELVDIPEDIKWKMKKEGKREEDAKKVKEEKKKQEEVKKESKKEGNEEGKKKKEEEKEEAVKNEDMKKAQEKAKEQKHVESTMKKEKKAPQRKTLQK